MKVRNGFVSNSSSTSFLLYGISMEKSDFEKMINENKTVMMEMIFKRISKLDLNNYRTSYIYNKYKECIEKLKEEDTDVTDIIDIGDMTDIIETNTIIDILFDEDLVFIGGSPIIMKDEETKIEWKNKIIDQLNKIGSNVDKDNCEWIAETIMT